MKANEEAIWSFPNNNGGEESGLNDPGIETFKDDPLTSLAREVLQNSCDATDEDNRGKPVEVHFKLLKIRQDHFPGMSEFKKILDSCQDYWQSSPQPSKFFANAIKTLSEPYINVLKISDFNTTGLTVGENGGRHTDWFRLTKSVGSSDKHAGKLGSFGIGKHAPYACSDLRTVFYGTKDKTGAVAFQGVSKLVSHINNGKVTQGTGYFGIPTDFKPIVSPNDIPAEFRRNKIGADVYIMGFHPFGDWEAKITKSVIENFLVAIHRRTLVVRVGDEPINDQGLQNLIKRYYMDPDSRYNADSYYAALVSDEASEHTDFDGGGKVTLRVLPNDNFRKKVGMYRRSGMKIFDKDRFHTPLRFAGVFTVDDQELDTYLRTLEPPSHNAWETERASNPDEARQLQNDIKRWINDKVRELTGYHDVKEIDADGVSQFLPDEVDFDPFVAGHEQIETISHEPIPNVEMRLRPVPQQTTTVSESDRPKWGGDDIVSEELEGLEETAGGGDGATERPHGPPNSGGGGESRPGGSGDDKEAKATSATVSNSPPRRVEMVDSRVFCTDPKAGKYRIFFSPLDGNISRLRVYIVGEVGSEPAPVLRYSVNNGPTTLASGLRGLIGPIHVPAGKRAVVDMELSNHIRCALEVQAYAD